MAISTAVVAISALIRISSVRSICCIRAWLKPADSAGVVLLACLFSHHRALGIAVSPGCRILPQSSVRRKRITAMVMASSIRASRAMVSYSQIMAGSRPSA